MGEVLHLEHERLDDVPLLLGFMRHLGLPALLDRHLGHHRSHRGLSHGWLVCGWLAYILSEGKNTPSPWHPRGCGLGLLIWMGLILVTTPLQALASVGICRSLDVKGQLMCEAVLPWLVPTAVCVLGGFAFAWSRARDSRP